MDEGRLTQRTEMNWHAQEQEELRQAGKVSAQKGKRSAIAMDDGHPMGHRDQDARPFLQAAGMGPERRVQGC